MTHKVKELYNEALLNDEFNNDMSLLEPKTFKKPNFFTCSIKKQVYASIYYGWTIGKGNLVSK